jgi:hypothetical protein
LRDFVAGAFGIAFAGVVALLLWLSRSEDNKINWIDIGTPGSEYNSGPSEAAKVEAAIAAREKRLAELR